MVLHNYDGNPSFNGFKNRMNRIGISVRLAPRSIGVGYILMEAYSKWLQALKQMFANVKITQ